MSGILIQQYLVILDLYGREITHDIRDACHRFRKAQFSKWFPSTLKANESRGVFKFLRFEEHSRKASFL